MKLYAVRVLTHNWLETCDFYEQKLGLTCEFKDGDFGWAEYDVGGAKLGVERVDPDAIPQDHAMVGRVLGISLKVDDAEKTYETLRGKGVEFLAPPEKQEWGGVTANFKDPAENVLTIMSEG